MVFEPEDSVAGRVKESVTGAPAWPVTSKRPALVRSGAATVLFTPGNTFPKLNCWAAATLMGVWTVAVAVMLALFVWAWAIVLVTTSAATTRVSLAIVRISSPVGCLAFRQLEGHSTPRSFWSSVLARLMPTARFLGTVKFLDKYALKSGSQDRTEGYTKQAK